MATQTSLIITNRSGKDVKIYLTLGATPGCVQNVADIPFLTNPVNPLQGWFILMQGGVADICATAGAGN